MSTALALLLFAQAASAAAPATPPAQSTAAAVQPVTVEYYYRIKWGSLSDFLQLYRKNHQPVLDAMKAQGFITATRMDEPFTHLAGGERWDLRVTITFRDAASAVGAGGAYDEAAGAAIRRLYPDRAAFEREENQRFSMVEEHWDVIVVPVAGE